jgi:hypothetical protein
VVGVDRGEKRAGQGVHNLVDTEGEEDENRSSSLSRRSSSYVLLVVKPFVFTIIHSFVYS